MLLASTRGISRLFNAEAPTVSQIENLINTLLATTTTTTVVIPWSTEVDAQGGTSDLTTTSVTMFTNQISFPVFWEWCQDNKDVYDYLDMITKVTFIAGSVKDVSAVNDSQRRKTTVSKLTSDTQTGEQSINHAFHKSSRNALWTYRIKDIIGEDWVEEIVFVESEDTVFDILELMMVSKCSVVAVVQPLKDDGLGKTFHKAKHGKYVGVIDHLTLISWLVHCYPVNFFNISNSNRKKRIHRLKGERIVDSREMMFNIATLSNMQNTNKRDEIEIDVSIEMLKQCRELGEHFATTTVGHLLQELQNKYQQDGFHNLNRVVTLHTEEYIYSAIYLFAMGHKNVAVRIAPAFDSRVVHILKDTDMAYFVHLHSPPTW